jgi:hypothetical protein
VVSEWGGKTESIISKMMLPATASPKVSSTLPTLIVKVTIRMSIRRFTRLTNAFSKKVQSHAASVALFITYYSFCRIHQTLRVTPAMAAGVTDTCGRLGRSLICWAEVWRQSCRGCKIDPWSTQRKSRFSSSMKRM